MAHQTPSEFHLVTQGRRNGPDTTGRKDSVIGGISEAPHKPIFLEDTDIGGSCASQHLARLQNQIGIDVNTGNLSSLTNQYAHESCVVACAGANFQDGMTAL